MLLQSYTQVYELLTASVDTSGLLITIDVYKDSIGNFEYGFSDKLILYLLLKPPFRLATLASVMPNIE